jgi:hypothetical protein
MLNQKIFVPLYDAPSDAQALATYRKLMPGYQVHGFHYGRWYPFDAVHCRTRALFKRDMLTLYHAPPRGEQSPNQPIRLSARVAHHGAKNLEAKRVRVFWQIGDKSWLHRDLKRTAPQRWQGELPAFPAGTKLRYYLEAEGTDGSRERLPRTAPEGTWQITIGDKP